MADPTKHFKVSIFPSLCSSQFIILYTDSGIKMRRFSIPITGILLLYCFVSVSQAEYLKYKDPKQPLNVRIKDLLKRMTLEEKIGQMTQIERSVATADVMKKYFIGKR